MSGDSKSNSERQRMWRLAGRYSSVGVEIAVCIGGTTWAGHYADQHFGTKPWLFLLEPGLQSKQSCELSGNLKQAISNRTKRLAMNRRRA
jgi:hypothetical protein